MMTYVQYLSMVMMTITSSTLGNQKILVLENYSNLESAVVPAEIPGPCSSTDIKELI